MLIEEHFDQLIKYLYNFKVVVGASATARHAITNKGLTPAMFLRPFFKANGRAGDFNLIDVQDYNQPGDRACNDRTKQMLASCVVNTKIQGPPKTRSEVEDHINNLGFMWFLEASKLYLETTSFDFDVTTIDQPTAIIHVMSVEDQQFSREYFKVIEATNALLKYAYKLNPDQYLKLESMVVILIDKSKGRTIEEALKYSEHLRKQHKVRGNMICRVEINTPEAQDFTIWSSFRRNSYAYKISPKQSEIVRFISKQSFDKLMNSANDYQSVVRDNIAKRVEYLNKQFKQFSKVSNKFIVGFFGGGGDKDKYSREELECRELADINFIQGDYRRAFQCYKELVGKFQNRNKRIYVSLLEMVSHCYVYSKIQGLGLKGDPYTHIQKQAKNILDYNSTFFLKYSIFLITSLYVLKVFKKELMKDMFSPRLKQFLRTNPGHPVMGYLLQQQKATFFLCFNPIEYHNYASALLKVGVHFLDGKLSNNSLRCFLIVESIYKNTFSPIQVFVQTYLSKLYLEGVNYANSVNHLRKGWNSQSKKSTDEKFNQFIKNYEKIVLCLDEAGAGLFLQKEGQHLRFPSVAAIDLTTEDQYIPQKLPRLNSLNSRPNDIPVTQTWAGMGSEFLGADNISRNTYAPQYRKLESFDAPTVQHKYLANRFKSLVMNDKVVEKNARVCFLKEKLRVQVWFANPFNQDLEITRCSLIFGKTQSTDYLCEPTFQTVKFKPHQQKVVEFIVTPLVTGMLELSHVAWNMYRLKDYYILPVYNKDSFRNLFYQLNVKEETGLLRVTPQMPKSSLFVGAIQKVPVELLNEGTQPIDQITVIVSDPRLFGFRNAKLPGIAPGQKSSFDLVIRVYDENCTELKVLFIYKTKDNIRMKRMCVTFTPEPVILVKDIKCEKISSHIHMLVFEVSKIKEQIPINKTINLLEDNETSLDLEQLILGEGFKILKLQVAKSKDRAVYTFFLQKNPHAKGEVHKFMASSVNIDDFKTYIEADEEVRRAQWALSENKYYPYDHVDRMNIIILFRYDKKLGMYHPQKVATNPKLLKILDKKGKIEDYLLPFNFKIKYPAVVEHNFTKQPCLSIPVEVAIKNIFTENTMNLLVEFYEDQQGLGFWQGITFKEVKLQRDEEIIFNVRFVVTQPGLYDLSRIKYTLLKDKNKTPAQIIHSKYEKLFLQVTTEKNFSKQVPSKNQPQPNIHNEVDLLG